MGRYSVETKIIEVPFISFGEKGIGELLKVIFEEKRERDFEGFESP